MAADYYEFNFGFGTGFIDKTHLEPVAGKQRVEDRLWRFEYKPLSNQNLVTFRDVTVYNAPEQRQRALLALCPTICVTRLLPA